MTFISSVTVHCWLVFPKTRVFLCFERFQQAKITRESKPRRSRLGIPQRVSVHHSTNVSVLFGLATLRLRAKKQRCQVSRAATHSIVICSILSSSCRHTKQGEVSSCRPCLALRSEVHTRCCTASQVKILQCRGAQHFQIHCAAGIPIHRGSRVRAVISPRPPKFVRGRSISVDTLDRMPKLVELLPFPRETQRRNVSYPSMIQEPLLKSDQVSCVVLARCFGSMFVADSN